MRIPTQEKTNAVIKSAITRLIKNISIIAIFVVIGVIALLYLGPEINIAAKIVFRMAVPSVILAIGITVINELWIQNGRRSAYDEPEYQSLLNTFDKKSDGLHYPTMQEFLDAERERRYYVEYDRLTRILKREESAKSKSDNKKVIKKLTKKIERIKTNRDTIYIKMPYEKSEEFDYLRYNIQDIVYKEYSPNDTHVHLLKARIKKYTITILFAIIGFNLLSIGGSMGNIWVAIIMTTLSAVSLIYAVVTGFSVGYNNIKVISTGVYKTANSFIDQAVAYCKREGKDLYYKGTTEFREPEIEESNEVIIPEVKKEEDIFTKAAIEVTNR